MRGRRSTTCDSERLVGNLHRAYADLDGRTDVDAPVAVTDMVDYNGGPVLIQISTALGLSVPFKDRVALVELGPQMATLTRAP